jgi:hypothetical protein
MPRPSHPINTMQSQKWCRLVFSKYSPNQKKIRHMKVVGHNEISSDGISGCVLRQATLDDVPSGIRTHD